MKSSVRDSSEDSTAESSLPPRKQARLRVVPSSNSPHKAVQRKSKPLTEAGRRKVASAATDRKLRRLKPPAPANEEALRSTDDNPSDYGTRQDSDTEERGGSEPPADEGSEEIQELANDSTDDDILRNPREDASETEEIQPDETKEGDSDSSSPETNSNWTEDTAGGSTKKNKKRTPGIIYLSYIPDGLTVAKTRELLGEFGEVKRMYFEPVKTLSAKTRPLHRFREGWVEFAKKKDAKRVAELLNTKPVGGKRRAPYRDCLWSIKYLNRFRWPHLAERLTYEKAVKDQRMRTEIAKAKREAKFYAKTLEQSIRRKKQRQCGEMSEANPSRIKLKKTDREIREGKPEPAPNEIADKSLLMSIFAKE